MEKNQDAVSRQDQGNIKGIKRAKPAENELKIGGICKQVVGKTAEWACTMEDGIPCLSISAKILLIWAENRWNL